MQTLSLMLVVAVSAVAAFSPSASMGRRPTIVTASRPSAVFMVEDLTPDEIKLKLEMLEKQLEVERMKRMLEESPASAPAAPVEAAAAAPVEVPAAIAPVVPEPAAVDMAMAPAVQEPAAAVASAFQEPAAAAAPEAISSANDLFEAAAPSVYAAADAISSGPVVETGFTAADLQGLFPVFGVAFTLFPAVVIIGSEIMKPKPVGGAAATPMPAPGDPKNAEQIFTSGLENLGKDPAGWLFSKKPTELYSNMPPPAPPAADAEGVVVPMSEAPVKTSVEDE